MTLLGSSVHTQTQIRAPRSSGTRGPILGVQVVYSTHTGPPGPMAGRCGGEVMKKCGAEVEGRKVGGERWRCGPCQCPSGRAALSSIPWGGEV